MIKIIKNGLIVTMNKNNDVLKKDIVIENDKIIDIVDNYCGDYDELIDASNKIIMPGLVNTHAHLGMSYFKAINDDNNFDNWWSNKILPVEKKLKDEDIYLSTLYSCAELIKTGTTTVCDMYFNEKSILSAIKESKVRCVFPLYFIGEYDEEYFNQREKLYLDNKNDEIIKFHVSLHSFYTCSDELIKRCKELSDKYNLLFQSHFCEHSSELNYFKEHYKMNPTDVLEKYDLLNNKLLLAHCTYLSDYDLNKLKDKNITVVHNPVSNLNLGCGIADIVKYKNCGLNISLGTDGVGSGNNLNMFYHMSFVDNLQKGLYKQADILKSVDVLRMATINGAKALGLDDEIGSIEINKKADIIILDLNNIEVYPYRNLYVELVHNVQSNNIDTTIINGEVLMKNHKLVNLNERELMNRINEIGVKNE